MKQLIDALKKVDIRHSMAFVLDIIDSAVDMLESQAATIALYETTAENCDLLRDKVDEQAREIERLSSAHNDASHYSARNEELRAELDALKAQPSGVVLPERISIAGHLTVDSSYRASGWNACLDEIARLNSSPVSAALTAHAPGECVAAIEKRFNDVISDLCRRGGGIPPGVNPLNQPQTPGAWRFAVATLGEVLNAIQADFALLAQQGKAVGDE